MFKILNKGRAFQVAKFVKLLNYPRASNAEFRRVLNVLQKQGLVVLQQGGYLGDSMHHAKIITVLEPIKLDIYKRVIEFGRVNFTMGEYTVHRTMQNRKCRICKHVIRMGDRYGAKVHLKRIEASRPRVFAQEIVCLPCLLEKFTVEDLQEMES